MLLKSNFVSFVSTRSSVNSSNVSFKEAVLTSQPEDGGLFVPSSFPKFSQEDIGKMANLSYQDLAKLILGKLIPIPSEDLGKIIDQAYGVQWDNEEITPLSKIGNNEYFLELYHGPTQAFKDIALQFLPRILSYYREDGQILRALGASSGDTISAAHFGIGNVPGLQSYFLLPESGPSKVQRLQATAHGFKNAITILINGDFDAGQKAIKSILTDPKYREFKENNNFITFNSINIARIFAQIVYYFKAYIKLVNDGGVDNGNLVNFSVPSGNFGNALAGVYAREMGLPINQINIATNKNDILDQFLETGIYKRQTIRVSRAPSQDISIASNFERMLFYTIKDSDRVTQLMKSLNEKGYFWVNSEELNDLKRILTGSKADDKQIDLTIKDVYSHTRKIIDPHSATGVFGSRKNFGESPNIPVIVLGTAGSIKFDSPPGVPMENDWYNRVVGTLSQREQDCLECGGDEEKIKKAIELALKMVDNRIQGN